MTHRAGPGLAQATRGLRYTAAVLAAVAIPLSGAVLYTATEIPPSGPSPTLAIPAPEVPQPPIERRSGGLASLSVTPSPQPPAVVYEPESAPVVQRVTPPPPTVVYVVPPVQVVPTPQSVAEIPEHADLDEPQRDEGERKRHNGPGGRHKRDKTTTPGTETTESEKPSQVCVVGICVVGEEWEEDPAAEGKQARKRASKEASRGH